MVLVVGVAVIGAGLYLLARDLGYLDGIPGAPDEHRPVVDDDTAAPTMLPGREPSMGTAPAGGEAPAVREGIAVEGETFPASEMPKDPTARFFRLAHRSTPGELHVKGRELVDALLSPGWTFVRYRDAATRDALLESSFTIRAEPMPGEPETASVQLPDALRVFQAGGFRVRLKGPVFEVARAGVR